MTFVTQLLCSYDLSIDPIWGHTLSLGDLLVVHVLYFSCVRLYELLMHDDLHFCFDIDEPCLGFTRAW